jgi:hypothetical protein
MPDAVRPHRHGDLELVDVANNQTIRKGPIGDLGLLPRAGEVILLPLGGPGSWARYKVLTLEYFMGYPDDATSPESITSYVKIAIYAERER